MRNRDNRTRVWVQLFFLICSLSGYGQVTLEATSGTATGSFTTLKGAFDAINAGTHTGAITVKINDNTTETASAVLNASGTGSASYTGITIYPTATGLSITGNLTAPLIDLNGADNVIIDGRENASGSTKSLTISNISGSNTAGTSTIRFINDASSNTLKYCTLKGSSTDAAAGIVFFSTGISTGNDDNTITDNDITNAANGSRPVNAVYASGSPGLLNSGNIIRDNNIFDFLNRGTSSNGINIQNNNTSFTISGNSFYETDDPFTVTSSAAVYHVVLISATETGNNGFTISGNYIGGRSVLCGGSAWTKTGQNNTFRVISVATATGTANSIQGNVIQNFDWTNSGAAIFSCILVANTGATIADIGTTSGNVIGAATGTGSIRFVGGATNAMFYGIWLRSSAAGAVVTCSNNTIGSITAAASSVSNATNFTGIFMDNLASSSITIDNNTIGSRTTAGSINASSPSAQSFNPQSVWGVRSAGGSATTVTISGNTIANMVNATTNTASGVLGVTSGIYATSGANNITDNVVFNLSSANSNTSITANASVSGIVMSSTVGAAQTVSRNTVYNLSNQLDGFIGSVIGIYYRGGADIAGTVSRNFIHGLSATGNIQPSGTARLSGIIHEAGAVTYSNNIVSLGSNRRRTQVTGISHSGGVSVVNNFYFNTVYISGSVESGETADPAQSYALLSSGTSPLRDLRNNVLVNVRSTTGGSNLHYALYIAASGGTLTCDYNNYYVSGTGGVLGYFGANATATPIVTGQDANSISTNPVFFSIGTTAIGYAPTVPVQGVVGTGITTDHLGSNRDATVTTMGAFECRSWVGGTSTGWTTSSNWALSGLPTAGSIVIVPTGRTNYPALSGNETFASLSLGSGASLDLGSNNLTIASNLSNSGSIDGSGKIVMGGLATQTISGTGTISNLEVNNSAGVTITSGAGNMQSLTGVLTPTAGTLTTNGNLTLKSDASGTARVAALGASASISGNVVAERYIKQNANSGGTGRAWRLVSVPVTGSGTLRDFFMNGRNGQDLTVSTIRDAETANSGTPIVGHNYATASAANTAGFDWVGVENQVSSLRRYVGNASGGTFLSENVPVMSTDYSNADQGYMVFTRGDRKVVFPSTSNASATTFRSTGALKTGDQTVSVVPSVTSKYTLVGNPYMSVLDLSLLHAHNSAVIKPSFWIWDANIVGTHKQGSYVNVYYNGTSWVTNTGTYTYPERIESGMAFFAEPVDALATATNITIKEAHKSAVTSAGIVPYGSETSDGHGLLYARLEVPVTGGGREIVDGVLIDFHKDFKESLGDLSDREKMRNTISQGAMWLSREGRSLVAEGLPWSGADKRSIPLYMGSVGVQQRVLRLDPRGMADKYVKAWLKDRLLHTETEIDMSKGLDYSFTGTGNSTTDSSRFELVFVEAGRPTTGGTALEPGGGVNPSVRLYPNPSRSTDVRLSLRSIPAGQYRVEVLDMSGRTVARSRFTHRGDNGEYRVLEGRRLSPGRYIVRLIDGKGGVQVLQMVGE